MTKTLKALSFIALAIGLSACGSMPGLESQQKSMKPEPNRFYYYSKTVPVRAQGYYETLDINRYSDAHLQQASYMFAK